MADSLRRPITHDVALLVGRILIAAFMLIGGLHKYQGLTENIAWYGRLGIPWPHYTAPFAAGFEMLTGVLLIVGWKTRAVALLVAAFALLDAVVVHGGLVNGNQQHVFLLDMAAIGGCLALYAAGGGRFSIDGRDR